MLKSVNVGGSRTIALSVATANGKSTENPADAVQSVRKLSAAAVVQFPAGNSTPLCVAGKLPNVLGPAFLFCNVSSKCAKGCD